MNGGISRRVSAGVSAVSMGGLLEGLGAKVGSRGILTGPAGGAGRGCRGGGGSNAKDRRRGGTQALICWKA